MALSTTLGGACLAYRYLAYDGFSNDHFVNLSRAQQVMLGEIPVRDFVDPGLPLMYYASALFQAAFGRTLFSEALLVFGSFALAAAVTCWLALRLTGSIVVASAVTLLQILVLPRSYGYPKILLYTLALLAIHLYQRTPRPARASLLGGLAAAAFLMRHDHGLFIGIVSAVAIVMIDFKHGLATISRRLAVYGLTAILVITPFLVLIETSVGLVQYVKDGLAFSRAEAARTSLAQLPRFVLDLGSAAAADSAEAWLFYLPWAVAAVGGMRLLLKREAATNAVVTAAVLLSALTAMTFLRSPLSARVADVWGALPVAFAYVLAPAFLGAGADRTVVASTRRVRISSLVAWLAAAVTVLVLTAFSVGVVGEVPQTVDTAGLARGQAGVADRIETVIEQLSTSPEDARRRELTYPAEDRTVLTYLFACTEPSDRIFAFMFRPEIYYLSGRGFAAGHVAFVVGYHGSEAEQHMAIERWSRQSVPIALALEDDQREAERYFALVAGELDRRYETVHRIADNSGGGKSLLIMTERGRTATSIYEPLGLPCFSGRTG